MAVIAPAPGIIWAATPSSSSSSSFACSQRPLAFSRVSLRSSFLGSNGVPWKPIGMRSTLADRCKCHGFGGGAQMNLFSRVARILKSYASSIISIFEDPEKILEQTVLDMNEDLKKMQLAVSQVLASQKQIETMYKSAEQTSEEWYKKAKLALNEGNEDLASEALNRHKFYADNASIWKAQLDQQKAVVNTIISKTNLLKTKIEEAKSKKDDLKARAQSVKIAAHLRTMLGDVNPSGSLATFGRIEEKVWAMEAHEQALNQLATDDLVGKFALLESHSVDDALARLKKESSESSKAEQKLELPLGRSTVAAECWQCDEVIQVQPRQKRRKNNKKKRCHSELQIEEALNELTKAQ